MVVLIIAIAAVLLLPAFAKLRGRARSLACLNQVRQWGLGIVLYAEDHAEFFPYEGHFLSPIDAGVNRQAWYNTVAESYTTQEPLWRLYHQGRVPLAGDRSLFVCPVVTKPPARPPTVRRPQFHYGFNNRLDPNGPGQYRRGQVSLPAQTVAFTENSEEHFPSTAGRFTRGRHLGRANLGFVDAHAEAVHSNDFKRTRLEDALARQEWDRPRKLYWYPFPEASP